MFFCIRARLWARGLQRASLNDKILIVDQQSIEKVVRKLLESQQGWNVCGEAADGKQAVEQAEVLNPHLVVPDIRMPTACSILHTLSALR